MEQIVTHMHLNFVFKWALHYSNEGRVKRLLLLYKWLIISLTLVFFSYNW